MNTQRVSNVQKPFLAEPTLQDALTFADRNEYMEAMKVYFHLLNKEDSEPKSAVFNQLETMLSKLKATSAFDQVVAYCGTERKRGSLIASCILGQIYKNQSPAQAEAYYLEAYGSGNVEIKAKAALNLGQLYLKGAPGVAQDVVQGRAYLLEAYGNENVEIKAKAALNLGCSYLINGPGVAQDVVQGRAYLLEAYESENVEIKANAAVNLGSLYLKGAPGVAQDAVQSRAYFLEAYGSGNVEIKVHAALNLGRLYLKGEPGVAQDAVQSRAYFLEAYESENVEIKANAAGGLGVLSKIESVRCSVEARAYLCEAYMRGNARVKTEAARHLRGLDTILGASPFPSSATTVASGSLKRPHDGELEGADSSKKARLPSFKELFSSLSASENQVRPHLSS